MNATEPASDGLGGKLRAIREGLSMSLRDVEARTDGKVKASHLSQVETQKVREPSLSMLRTLAPVYGMTFRDLLLLLEMIEPESEEEADKRQLLLLSVARDLDQEGFMAAMSFVEHLASESRKRNKV